MTTIAEIKQTPLSMKVNTCFVGHTQYFGGHHCPTFPVTVDGLTTYNTLKTEVLDWQTTEHLADEVFYFEHAEGMFNAAVEELFSSVEDMGAVVWPDLEVPPEDEEAMQEWYDNWEGVAWFTVKLIMPEEDDEV
jgi:hypothetical protein